MTESADQSSEENHILHRAIEGDADSFGKLYRNYVNPVYRFINIRIGDQLDAEDLTEEVFLRVWRSLPNYKEQGVPFIAFIFKIARNAIIDYYRHSDRRTSSLETENQDLKEDSGNPEEKAFASREQEEIRNKLDKLKDDYRMVLILRFLSELSPEETAKVMGRSTGAVRVLQHRALTALRKLVNES